MVYSRGCDNIVPSDIHRHLRYRTVLNVETQHVGFSNMYGIVSEYNGYVVSTNVGAHFIQPACALKDEAGEKGGSAEAVEAAAAAAAKAREEHEHHVEVYRAVAKEAKKNYKRLLRVRGLVLSDNCMPIYHKPSLLFMCDLRGLTKCGRTSPLNTNACYQILM